MTADRIAQRAKRLALFATALLIVIPLGALFLFATGGVTPDSLQDAYGIAQMPDVLAPGPTLVWSAVEATRLALLFWVIWTVRVWLRACASGAVFAGSTAQHVQRIGTALLALAAAQIIGHTIAVAALTWGNPPGARSLAIAFGSTEMILVLAAGLVTLFGWIQSEAARMSAENESFV
ncbi:MAG: hypothetical protein AAF727_01070 [Pseudomonadota bacterium]